MNLLQLHFIESRLPPHLCYKRPSLLSTANMSLGRGTLCLPGPRACWAQCEGLPRSLDRTRPGRSLELATSSDLGGKARSQQEKAKAGGRAECHEKWGTWASAAHTRV